MFLKMAPGPGSSICLEAERKRVDRLSVARHSSVHYSILCTHCCYCFFVACFCVAGLPWPVGRDDYIGYESWKAAGTHPDG